MVFNISKFIKNIHNYSSKIGRLIEIKNPYDYDASERIKPEYTIQILQQQYTTQLPVCDFVETTIVDKFSTTSAGNYKAYENLEEMLSDKLPDILENTTVDEYKYKSRIKNHNIPKENLNKFGNEKGLLVWYQKIISASDIRNKYIMYPLNIPYKQCEIEKWIIDTNSKQFSEGFNFTLVNPSDSSVLKLISVK